MNASPHPLDHLVLPTVGIAAARERLGRLGFTVAADARHPFGTENACVFLADKTYLEPLGVTDRQLCVEAALEGNVFVARDQAYRFRLGEEGFSSVVFGTDDAGADHGRFVAYGASAGKPLEFARAMRMPDGTEAVAAFRLAFAADLRAPDFLAFCCQRINPLPADRAALERHANGVVGMTEVALSAPDPAAYAAFLQQVGNGPEIAVRSYGILIQLPNVRLAVMTPDAMEAFYELPVSPTDRGLQARAVLFAVRDLSVTAAHLADNGVSYTRKNNRVLVQAAPGQGALFGFEETA